VNRIEILPNLCTAANLLLGVSAIAAIINNHYQLSVGLIVLAAIFDRFDGTLARRLNVDSVFGKEFDSLADLVSFGVAPAALLYTMVLGQWGPAGLACFILFTLCGAFRLARFNVSNSKAFFQGLPITAAGTILAILIIIISSPAVKMGLCIILALAMISSIRVPKI